MRMKPLVRKFTRNELEEVCRRECWSIPTIEQAKDIPCALYGSDTIIWVKEKPDEEGRAFAYHPGSGGTVMEVTDKLLLNAIVIVNDKDCSLCSKENYCDILDAAYRSGLKEGERFYCSMFIGR